MIVASFGSRVVRDLLRPVYRLHSSLYQWDMPENASEEVPEERTVSESASSTVIPFSTDPILRAEYRSFTKQIRIGKLLENMDLMAGKVSYLHADPSMKNTVMVTAACDRITHTKRAIDPNEDILVKGFPTYVGQTSMEIRVELSQRNEPPLLAGYFLFASRDPLTFTSKKLPTLKLETEKEKKLFNDALLRKQENKKQKMKYSELMKPTEEEGSVIHELFLARKAGAKENSIRGTRFDSTLYMHPRGKDQNIHGHIFGGYLMREAFELAFLTACTYSGEHTVSFIMMDEIQFLAPVKIGQILSCSALVIFTDPTTNRLQISVQAKVVNPKDRSLTITNTFQFSFKSYGETLAPLNPSSYGESMKYLVGRRAIKSLEKE